MSSTWNLIDRILREDPKDSLLAYIARAYGEHEADELRPHLDSVWNAKSLPQAGQALINRYVDPKVTDFVKKGLASMGLGEPKRGRGRPPGTGKNQQAAQQRQFMDPDQARAAADQAKATAAMRPDRAGTQANLPSRAPVMLRPGERPQHDVGTAGQSPGSMPGHTRPPQKQTSQEVIPSTLGRDLASLRAKLKTLQQDPKRNAAAITQVQQQIDRLGNVGASGVKDAQKRVDYITQTYGPEQGDALAKKLGVPTTKERTRRVRDPQTGEEKVVTQVWEPEKVSRWLQREPDLKPGVYDLPGKPKLPGPDDREPKGSAPGQVHKPMMKAPKGLDQAGLAQLSKLRSQFSAAKKANDAEAMASAKQQIDQIMGSAGEVIDVVRPGTAVGQRWRPSGVSQKVKQTRADQATGQFKHGSRFTNPGEEGQEVVWDGTDWVLPSVFAASRGQKNAAGG